MIRIVGTMRRTTNFLLHLFLFSFEYLEPAEGTKIEVVTISGPLEGATLANGWCADGIGPAVVKATTNLLRLEFAFIVGNTASKFTGQGGMKWEKGTGGWSALKQQLGKRLLRGMDKTLQKPKEFLEHLSSFYNSNKTILSPNVFSSLELVNSLPDNKSEEEWTFAATVLQSIYNMAGDSDSDFDDNKLRRARKNIGLTEQQAVRKLSVLSDLLSGNFGNLKNSWGEFTSGMKSKAQDVKIAVNQTKEQSRGSSFLNPFDQISGQADIWNPPSMINNLGAPVLDAVRNVVNLSAATDITLNFPTQIADNQIMQGFLMEMLKSALMPNISAGERFDGIVNFLCSFGDTEFEANLLADKSKSSYFCGLQDFGSIMLACGEASRLVTCEDAKNYYSMKEDFPTDKVCKLSQKVLQASKFPKSFTFDQLPQLPNLSFEFLLSEKYRPTASTAARSGTPSLPILIDKVTSDSEALTYLMLFRIMITLASFSQKPYLCGADHPNPEDPLPGWKTVTVIAAEEDGDPLFTQPGTVRDAIPLAWLMQSNDAPCNFLFAIRGTASLFEWEEDFRFWLVPLGIYTHDRTWDKSFLAHAGMFTFIRSILPLMEAHMQKQTQLHNCPCDKTKLMFSGHSLGGGMAHIMSLIMAERYGPLQCGLQVSSVLFGALNTLNEAAAERSARIVNQRLLFDDNDPLLIIPCHSENCKHGHPRCDSGHAVAPGVGRDMFSTNFGKVRFVRNYDDKLGGTTVGGLLSSAFPSAMVGKQSVMTTWMESLISRMVPSLLSVPSLGTIGSAHICAVACEFSQRSCGPDFQWWCTDCPELVY